MTRTLAALLVLAVATPVVSIPLAADAQVLVGRGAARRDPPRRYNPPPRLSDAEEQRLDAARAEVDELEGWIAEVEAQGEAAGVLTDEQKALLQTYDQRRDAAQEIIDRLEAKLNR